MGALVAAGAVALVVGTPAFDPVRAAWADVAAHDLRGTWVATAGVRDGKAIPKDELARTHITLRSPRDGFLSQLTDLTPLIDDPTARTAAVTFQPWAAPGGFTISRQSGARVSLYPGISEHAGDTLRLCVDLRFSPDGPPRRVRPTAFAAPAGSGLTLLTLVREKP